MPETQISAGKEQERYYPYSGLFYVTRERFWTAGQDSFTLPPAQDEDMFMQLNNIEPVLQGVLQRRRGYSLFSSQTPTLPYTLAYSFRSEILGIRSVVFTGLSNVLATSETGVTIINPLFVPSIGATEPRMVLSRSYGYFTDGVAADYKKWDGTTNANSLTKWGIDINQVASLTFGPNNAGTGANSGAGTAWSNPGNVTGPCNAATASVTLAAHTGSQTLAANNFLFAGLTGETITGIKVTIVSGSSGNGFQPTLFTLALADGTTGPPQALPRTGLGAPLTTTTYGGPNNLLGFSSITPAQVQGVGFGVNIIAQNGSSVSFTSQVDCVAITIFTLPAALTVGAPVAGNITLLNGRTYFYAFQNSNTGHTSDLSAASVTTGPLTNNNVPLSNIAVSTDPQVNTVLLLATADGNDQTTLYLIGTIPNGVTTFTDSMPDTTLLLQPLYQYTDQLGVLHGIANNNPPPTINFPTKHKGRIYGSIGQTLFFSKSADDVTTADGLTTSKWEEAWPAVNQLDISEQAETIIGLMSDGETLWIATERAIRRLVGDSPQNFQKPEIQFNETGLINQDAWKVVFSEGQPVGTMWLTPDLRVIGSDFNTYKDEGGPVQDVLNSINLSAASTIHAQFVTKGPADYFMLYIPTGIAVQPNTICVFNMRTKKWCVWSPTDQITASTFFIDADGFPRWLIAANAGNLYEWTNGTFQDQIGVSPTSYTATIQTCWMDFGDYSLRKFVNQIIPTTADVSSLTIGVEAASNELDFNSPLVVVSPTTVIPASIPDDVFVPLASGPSHNRFFRFTFSSPPSAIQNILTGYSIEAGVFHKY